MTFTPIKIAKRIYECNHCGNRIEAETNHRGEIYPNCTGTCTQLIGERYIPLQTAHKFIKDKV